VKTHPSASSTPRIVWPEILLQVLAMWAVMSLTLVGVAIAAAVAGAWWLVATPLRLVVECARWAGRG
jgi:hypothetical protein